MALVTRRVFSCDNGAAYVDLTYDDVPQGFCAFDSVDIVNNRGGDLIFTVTDTASGQSWSYTARAGRTGHRKLSSNFGFQYEWDPTISDPITGEIVGEWALTSTLYITVASRAA